MFLRRVAVKIASHRSKCHDAMQQADHTESRMSAKSVLGGYDSSPSDRE